MKIACANALAQLAREDVPDEVAAAYHGRQLKFGREYIIPTPFDPQADLVRAALHRPGGDGHRRGPQADRRHGRLSRRAGPAARSLRRPSCRRSSGAVLGGRQDASSSPRARSPPSSAPPTPSRPRGSARPSWCGREELIRAEHAARRPGPRRRQAGGGQRPPVATATPPMSTPSTSGCRARATCSRDVQRLINQDRNTFAASMVAARRRRRHGHRRHPQLRPGAGRGPARHRPGARRPGHGHVGGAGQGPHPVRRRHQRHRAARRRTSWSRSPSRRPARSSGWASRRAWPSCRYSTFGNPDGRALGEACARRWSMLDSMDVDFEYEGEMPPDLALDPEPAAANYPFMRLTEPGQRADHAGASTRPRSPPSWCSDLGEGDGGRAAAGGPEPARCRSARCPPRSARSSTWPPSPPTSRTLSRPPDLMRFTASCQTTRLVPLRKGCGRGRRSPPLRTGARHG